jgi:ATP synthase F1 complex assembly factor 1
VKIELLEKESPEAIHKIWTEYHADKDCITASIPAAVYGALYQNSLKYPMVSLQFNGKADATWVQSSDMTL